MYQQWTKFNVTIIKTIIVVYRNYGKGSDEMQYDSFGSVKQLQQFPIFHFPHWRFHFTFNLSVIYFYLIMAIYPDSAIHQLEVELRKKTADGDKYNALQR